MKQVFIIHYHEIALKGGNRDFFEKKLIDNIKRSLKALGRVNVKRLYGRILVVPGSDSDINLDKVKERLKRVFGIAYFSLGCQSGVDIKLGKKALPELFQEIFPLVKKHKFDSFKVEVKRQNKNFPLNSPEIEKQLGGLIYQGLKRKKEVKMKNPELTVYLEITDQGFFFYFNG